MCTVYARPRERRVAYLGPITSRGYILRRPRAAPCGLLGPRAHEYRSYARDTGRGATAAPNIWRAAPNAVREVRGPDRVAATHPSNTHPGALYTTQTVNRRHIHQSSQATGAGATCATRPALRGLRFGHSTRFPSSPPARFPLLRQVMRMRTEKKED